MLPQRHCLTLLASYSDTEAAVVPSNSCRNQPRELGSVRSNLSACLTAKIAATGFITQSLVMCKSPHLSKSALIPHGNGTNTLFCHKKNYHQSMPRRRAGKRKLVTPCSTARIKHSSDIIRIPYSQSRVIKIRVAERCRHMCWSDTQTFNVSVHIPCAYPSHFAKIRALGRSRGTNPLEEQQTHSSCANSRLLGDAQQPSDESEISTPLSSGYIHEWGIGLNTFF